MIALVMAPHRALPAFVAALALATASARVRAEPPAPQAETGAPLRAELVIEAELGDASAVVVERVRVRGEARLRQREVLPARDASDPQIRIRIEPLGDEPGYRCHYGAYDGAGVIAQSDGVSLCKLCTEAELVDHVEAAIDRVVPKLAARTVDVVPPPRVDPKASPRAAPLSSLGKAGIGVLIGGVVASVAGAVVLSRPTVVKDDELTRERTSYRNPGIAVLSVGLAVLVAGATMLAVDRHRARRRGAATASRGLGLRF